MAAWLARSGLLLFTENYAACIAFYRDVLELPIEEQQENLTRFGFGDAYLMVERGGVATAAAKSRAESPVTLRLNVEDIDPVVAMLRARGVAVEVRHWDWGVTGHFTDPDGNRCEVRDPFHAPAKT
jgi:lactoylglutathione lyase